MPSYDFKIATTLLGLTNVESLATPLPAPHWSYKPYRDSEELMDHSLATFGKASVTWRWGFLTNAQRDQLRTFCTGGSATVYIRTKKFDSNDSYTNMQVEMYWPQEEDPQAGRKLDFSISFVVLAEV